MYDGEVVNRLMEEEGYSYSEAVRIASTEMCGANEGLGGINSLQTGCNHLKYGEGLPDSRGRKEGEEATLKAIAEKYGLESLTTNEAEALTDAILRKGGGDLTPKEARRLLKGIRKERKKKKTK